MPPEWMWPLDVEVSKWLDEVMEARAEKSGEDYDESSPNKGREKAPMMSNEYAERFKKD